MQSNLPQNIIKYITETNKLLFSFVCIFIFIQTSVPPIYNINNIKLIDLSDNKYLINPKINLRLLEGILSRINDIQEQYKDDMFWKYSKNFLEEYNDPGITSPKDQIINIIKHLINMWFYSYKYYQF